jgi:hypothetical protein
MLDDTAEHDFVEIAFHSAGKNQSWFQRRHLVTEQRKLLWFRWPGFREHDIGQRNPTLDQSSRVLQIGGNSNPCTFGMRPQEQYFVKPNPLVPQQIRRVRTNQHLPAGSTLHPRKHGGQEANHIWMQGELGLLKEQRPRTIKDSPQEPEKA